MGKHVIRCTLTEQSIHDAIEDLKKYRNSIEFKLECFTELLAKHGVSIAITTARSGKHFGKLITFGYEPRDKSDGIEYVVYATSTDEVSTWYVTTPEGEVIQRQVDVSPMLMEEYGSGNHAVIGVTQDGSVIGGRGTLDNYGHAFQNQWSFATKHTNGKLDGWITTTGYVPTRPMYRAQNEMMSIVNECARQAFN